MINNYTVNYIYVGEYVGLPPYIPPTHTECETRFADPVPSFSAKVSINEQTKQRKPKAERLKHTNKLNEPCHVGAAAGKLVWQCLEESEKGKAILILYYLVLLSPSLLYYPQTV